MANQRFARFTAQAEIVLNFYEKHMILLHAVCVEGDTVSISS